MLITHFYYAANAAFKFQPRLAFFPCYAESNIKIIKKKLCFHCSALVPSGTWQTFEVSILHD